MEIDIRKRDILEKEIRMKNLEKNQLLQLQHQKLQSQLQKHLLLQKKQQLLNLQVQQNLQQNQQQNLHLKLLQNQ